MKKVLRSGYSQTGIQEVNLNKTLSIYRNLYNDALDERRRQAELNRLKRDFQIFPWGSSIKVLKTLRRYTFMEAVEAIEKETRLKQQKKADTQSSESAQEIQESEKRLCS